ncbi:MAG: PD-(D/E)XK nuclease family protein [Bdellovibrionota bacterium]
MSENIVFTQQSVFLCGHKAIKLFAQHYNQSYNINSSQHWSILCERKEDIVNIRNQIFIELESITQKKVAFLSGISIYTLDTLAQKICASLAHIEQEKYRQQIPQTLFNPYLDITAQEKLVEIILNLFGYNASDSPSLARQLLTLLDTQLPPHTNIVELILATQENRNKYIAEVSLRQILATIQHAKIELSQYARFQTLVHEYLNQFFLEHILDPQFTKSLFLPDEIFSSNVLWIGAPEYELYEKNNLKPGNFQSSIVYDFKDKIKKFHTKGNGFFYDSKTVLKSLEAHFPVDVYLSSNDHNFFNSTSNLILEPNSENFVLLADFDPHSFQATCIEGSGAYALTKKDLENWKNYSNNEQPEGHFEVVKNKIDEKYDDFLNVIYCVQMHDSMQKIAQIYSLNLVDINHLFMSSILREKVFIGQEHPLANAPKILSFFNGEKLPHKIICIGRPHAAVSQSFHVKILNQVFFNLRQCGVDIEIPATETMYRLFWKNLILESKQVDFWLQDKNELEKFPNYFQISNIFNLNKPIYPHFDFCFKTQQQNLIPNWQELFLWKNSHISITQFEEYVFCSHKFYLKYLLKIKKKEQIQTVDFMEIGTKMHKIAEQLITRLVCLFGNQGYVHEMPKILNSVIEILKNEDLFLSFEKEVWLQAFNEKLENTVMLAFQESIELIWGTGGELSFIHMQQREILKRTFLKFLLTELANLKNNSKLKVGLYREFPIQFHFFGLKFSGRIDRIDLTAEGLEIIDYKTSNIAKVQKDLTLLSADAKQNMKLKLSVQGAMYSYGLEKAHFVASEEVGIKLNIIHFIFLKI